MRIRYVCEKVCRQNLYRGSKTSDNAAGKPIRGFSLQHKTFSALEPQLRSRFKELRVGSGLHSRNIELFSVKYFHAFVSTLNYVSPIGANSD